METAYGSMRIIVQGDRSKPAILTYHDIGLNSKLAAFGSSVANLSLYQSLKNQDSQNGPFVRFGD